MTLSLLIIIGSKFERKIENIRKIIDKNISITCLAISTTFAWLTLKYLQKKGRKKIGGEKNSFQ